MEKGDKNLMIVSRELRDDIAAGRVTAEQLARVSNGRPILLSGDALKGLNLPVPKVG